MERKIEWVDNTYYEDDDMDLDLEDDNDEDDEDGYSENRVHLPDMKKVIVGPFGAFEVSNFTSPYKDHLIFTGHTNFVLTRSIVDIIDACEGVDALRVPSKYTFHISVGLGFDIEEVLGNIESKLGVIGDFTDDDDVNNDLSKIIADLVKELTQYKMWAFYVMPNGEYETAFTNSEDQDEIDDFMNKVEMFKECKKISNGIFFSNETYNNK